MHFPASVDAYLSALDEPQRALLAQIRATVRELCPDAVEAIAYGMPGFRLGGRLLISYAGYKRHCAIYPASGRAVEALGEELAPFLAQKATIRFTAQHPLPDEVLRRYVAVRVEEVRAVGGGG
jgi:uncharacterized protein YdhG (YjbR/CyaY superfamily)